MNPPKGKDPQPPPPEPPKKTEPQPEDAAMKGLADSIEKATGPDIKRMEAGTLAEHGQHAAVLVLVDPTAYMGEREKAKAQKDQPDLPFDPDTGEIRDPDAPPPPPAPDDEG